MSKQPQSYCQCSLKRTTENIFTVSWLPSTFAVKGKVLSLKNSRDQWEDWTVLNVSEPVPAHIVEDHRDDWRKYRENTDI